MSTLEWDDKIIIVKRAGQPNQYVIQPKKIMVECENGEIVEIEMDDENPVGFAFMKAGHLRRGLHNLVEEHTHFLSEESLARQRQELADYQDEFDHFNSLLPPMDEDPEDDED